MPWDDSEFRKTLDGMTDAQISLALVKRDGEFDKQNRRDLAEWVLRNRESEKEAGLEARRDLRENITMIMAALANIIAIIAIVIAS